MKNFNHESKNTLDSVVSQNTNFPFEVIICTDNNFEEISQYIQNYQFIKVIQKENSDNDKNNLEMLLAAKGEYICFLKEGEFYKENDRCQRLVSLLDENIEYVGVFEDEHCIQGAIDAETYLENNLCINCSNFVFRNIFYGKLPEDFNKYMLDCECFPLYMLKYGKVFCISKNFAVGGEKFLSNNSLENVKALFYSEINHSILPFYEKLICKNSKEKLKKTLEICHIGLDADVVKALIEASKEQNCYFTYNILNYRCLSLFEKINFYKNIFDYLYLNRYPIKYENSTIYYFNSRQNFGDLLNVYILQRLFKINVCHSRVKDAKIVGLGSLLELILNEVGNFKLRRILKTFTNPFVVFSTGFIEDEAKFNLNWKIKLANFKWFALRGKLSYARIKKYFRFANLSDTVLGDAGLLSNKLIDTSNVQKKYKVGIIFHYVDTKEEVKNNIKVSNFKYIDIQNNPVKMLNEMLECEFILSSAMHGLIAADSLGIPNKWIELSDNLTGKHYKFKDYYSVFDIENPKPVDLRSTEIHDEDISRFKDEYIQENRQEKIKSIQDKLLGKKIL